MLTVAPVAATWPRRLRRNQAAQYLKEVHGIGLTPKTLQNRNAAGKDPRPEYLGTIPYYTPTTLDAFAASCFQPESPITVTRRRIAEAVRVERERAWTAETGERAVQCAIQQTAATATADEP
jgi:hypothetical protein